MARKTYSVGIKNKAKELRQRGLSYKEISVALGIVKSTACLWTNGVELTPAQKEKLYTKGIIALKNSPNNSRERRKREIESILAKAEKEIKLPISDDGFKLLGAMLYWAEGDKTTHFAIANSDPLLIKFMVKWIKIVLKCPPSLLRAHLNIYPQQNESEIKKFWSDLTGIPLENFGKSFIKPLNKNYKKNTLYYGTIKVRLPKGSNAKCRLFGWLRVFLRSLETDVDIIETKWNKLKTDYKRP